jgi:hypothetical protein
MFGFFKKKPDPKLDAAFKRGRRLQIKSPKN